ncbi:MAG: hypothetical protein WBB34_12440 [Xanthobacteraceae bacterium]
MVEQQQAERPSEQQVLAPLTQQERLTAQNQLNLGLRLPGEPLLSREDVTRRNQARLQTMFPDPPEMSMAWSNGRWDRRTQNILAGAWVAAILYAIAFWVFRGVESLLGMLH